VCRQLAQMMGGRMWAADRAGGGAEFGFALPFYGDAVAAESRDRRASVQDPFNIKRDRGASSGGRENRRAWQSQPMGG